RSPGGAAPGYDVDQLRDLMRQLVQGVRALHVAGKVHRDLKPSNVLVTREARLVLRDFGLVTRVLGGQDTITGHAAGTAEYMSPEQAAGADRSEATDWYAAGGMPCEALTGRLPFAAP